MGRSEYFETDENNIKYHWDYFVINELGNKPKDMNLDRKVCSNCGYTEVKLGTFEKHSCTVRRKKEENKREMYFLETGHVPKDPNKKVYKVGKTDKNSDFRLKSYKPGEIKKIIDIKEFINCGVNNIEKELLNALIKDKNIVHRKDLNTTTGIKTQLSASENNIKKLLEDFKKSKFENLKKLENLKSFIIPNQKRKQANRSSSLTPNNKIKIRRLRNSSSLLAEKFSKLKMK